MRIMNLPHWIKMNSQTKMNLWKYATHYNRSVGVVVDIFLKMLAGQTHLIPMISDICASQSGELNETIQLFK